MEITTRLGLEGSGGMVRVGPVHYIQASGFGCAVPAIWGTVEEIQKFEGRWRILAASHRTYNPERLFAGYHILG